MVMSLNTRKYLDDVQSACVVEKIREIEKKTSGEIAVVVTPASGKYLDVICFSSMIISMLFSFLAVRFIPGFSKIPIPFTWSVAGELEVFIMLFIFLYMCIGYFFGKYPVLLRIFISGKRKEFEIEKKSVQTFYKYGLYKTSDATGILILISLLEKKVFVMADKGVYAKISAADLQKYAASIALGVKNNNQGAAIRSVIDSLEPVLVKHFPIKPGDVNELPDRIIFE
jgi:putative membrane protein